MNPDSPSLTGSICPPLSVAVTARTRFLSNPVFYYFRVT